MAAKGVKAEKRPTVKLTLEISRELNLRLFGVAQKEECGKIEMAIRLLDQGLKRHGGDKELKSFFTAVGRSEAAD